MLPNSEQKELLTNNGERKGDSSTQLQSTYDAVEQARREDPDGLISLGLASAYSNRLGDAERYLRQAADSSRRFGDKMGLARALLHLATEVLIVRGQFHLALTLVEEAGILREEVTGKHLLEAFWRGFIYQEVGDRRHCREVLDELVSGIEPGTSDAAAYYLLWARLALDEDEPERAKELLRLGLRISNRIEANDLNLRIRLEFSRYHRIRDEAPVARTWAEEALHFAQEKQLLYFTGLALIERAQANWETGDAAGAEADLAEAWQALEPLQAAYDLARVSYLRALWYRQAGRPEAESAWIQAVRQVTRDGFAFLLEKEQDTAFPLIAAHVRSKNSEVRTTTEELLRHLANVPPPSLHVLTLGQFAVWKGRRRIPDQAWSRRKAGELFRYLLLQHNRAAGHEVIIEALWPDNSSDNPSDLLHQSTSALRHALEPDLPDKFPSRYLKVEGEHIALVLPPGSEVDFEHFERALPLAIQTQSTDRLQEALNLYSGEVFPSDRYADWSAEKRQYLAEMRQRGLVSLAQAYLDKGQYYNVVNCCRQVMQVDAWNEEAVLLAMRAYTGLQDVPHALQIYKQLEKTLKNELEILPRSDIRDFARTLRQR
jgi:DNA-binding SARP family transcriptional activator